MLKTLFGSIGKNLMSGLDGLFTSDDERNQAKIKIQEILMQGRRDVQSAAIDQEKERTERLRIDMQSDSRLSKNIRPLSMAFVLGVVTLLAVTDGNLQWDNWSFVIQQSYVDLFNQLLLVMVSFYFGGRSFEKVQAGKRVEAMQKAEKVGSKKSTKADNLDLFGPEE